MKTVTDATKMMRRMNFFKTPQKEDSDITESIQNPVVVQDNTSSEESETEQTAKRGTANTFF